MEGSLNRLTSRQCPRIGIPPRTLVFLGKRITVMVFASLLLAVGCGNGTTRVDRSSSAKIDSNDPGSSLSVNGGENSSTMSFGRSVLVTGATGFKYKVKASTPELVTSYESQRMAPKSHHPGTLL